MLLHAAVLQPVQVEVKSVGEHVQFSIGNWHRLLHYEAAILLASWLRSCARAAKEWSGGAGGGFRMAGTMHDANDHRWLMRGQPFTPGGVRQVSREVLKTQQVEVEQVADAVRFTVGHDGMTLPYPAALQIAQWLRLKGKESKMRAGDIVRHWSEITKAHEARRGPGVTRG